MIIRRVINQRLPPPYQASKIEHLERARKAAKIQRLKELSPVKESGLADIGTTDEDDGGEEIRVDLREIDL